MGYVNNAKLIEQWNTRYQAIINRINTLYDVSAHNLVFEDTGVNTVLGAQSLDAAQGAGVTLLTVKSPEVVSNEQAPQITIETPTLILNPEEGSEEDTQDKTVEDPSDQEEEKEDTVEETVEETVDQEDETVEEPSDEETDETEEEEEITSEE